MTNKEKLIFDIESDARVKRSKELEALIDNDLNLKNLLNEKKRLSKEMVLAKHIGLLNAYKLYKEQYDKVDEEIASYPFVEEYMDILQDLHNDLDIMVSYIEKNINNDLK